MMETFRLDMGTRVMPVLQLNENQRAFRVFFILFDLICWAEKASNVCRGKRMNLFLGGGKKQQETKTKAIMIGEKEKEKEKSVPVDNNNNQRIGSINRETKEKRKTKR